MRCSIHIDAGYLFSALASRETGSANRAAIMVDEEALVKALVEIATGDSGLRLLRVLWYDAAKDGVPDPHQRRIGMLDSVKLRMGRINPYGEQKGVDLRLGLDLVSLGVNRAAEVAYILSGDDDLTEAVSDAQDLGLQVKLICVPAADGRRTLGVAANLSLAVDGTLTIPETLIAATVTRAGRPAAKPDGAPTVSASVVPPRPAVIPPVTPPPAKRSPVMPVGTVEPVAVRPVPAPTPAPIQPQQPVYSSSTGGETVLGAGGIDHDMIEDVAQSVFDVWVSTATQEELNNLQTGRPNIPQHIDRILLADMVTRSGIYDIPSYARFGLRDAFWEAVSRR